MNPEPVSFSGTYELRHGLRGLHLQLVPFAVFSVALLLAAAVSAAIHIGVSVLVMGCAVALVLFTANSYRRERQKVEVRPPQGGVTGEVSQDGLLMRSDGEEQRRQWGEFARIQVFPTMILLYFHDGSALMLPAEFFDAVSWRAAKNIANSTKAAQESVIPKSLRRAFLALCAALALVLILWLLRAAR
jgi:YcxB-like protein